jgi:2,4'-dihydroxyacetophenone dioxygenase
MNLDPSLFPDAIAASALPWGPTRAGLAIKPLRFFPDMSGYVLLLRVEPGTVIPRHRHTGAVHAYHLSGQRKLLETGEVIQPGGYVYEPPGNVDSWSVVGDEPLVAFIVLWGAVDYLDEQGNVTRSADAATAFETYRGHLEAIGVDAAALFGKDQALRHAG